MNQQLITKLREIFENNGVTIYEENLEHEIDYDSLQFVSILADLEAEFNFEFPEEVFSGEGLNTPLDFYSITVRQI